MNDTRLRLGDAVAAVLGALGDGDGDVDASTGSEQLAANDALARLRRVTDAVHGAVAAEIARRSRPEYASDGLARRNGFRNATTLVAATTGGSSGDAARMIQVGEATTRRSTFGGEPAPPRRPHVADAVAAGRLSTWAASAIVTLLDSVALRADPDAIDAMERTLVAKAPGLSMDQVRRLLLRAEAVLDPSGVDSRAEASHGRRSLTIRTERDGMVTLSACLDAETAAPVVTALQGLVTEAMRRRADDPAVTDERSVTQLYADALTDLCRHALACDRRALPGLVSTTVIVRVGLDTLRGGSGTATVEGLDAPLSASAARRFAASAGIIPVVLGGDSERLDWGRDRRLFTRAQRLALLERDGGCASCGAPPGHTQVHHTEWWTRVGGATDLRNGVLLCSACHHRIHSDALEIHVDGTDRGSRVWFTPPAHVDPTRTPRLGARARFDLAAA